MKGMVCSIQTIREKYPSVYQILYGYPFDDQDKWLLNIPENMEIENNYGNKLKLLKMNRKVKPT